MSDFFSSGAITVFPILQCAPPSYATLAIKRHHTSICFLRACLSYIKCKKTSNKFTINDNIYFPIDMLWTKHAVITVFPLVNRLNVYRKCCNFLTIQQQNSTSLTFIKVICLHWCIYKKYYAKQVCFA